MIRSRESIALVLGLVGLLLVPGCTNQGEIEPMTSMTWAGLDISYPPDWDHYEDGQTVHFSPAPVDNSQESDVEAEFVVSVVWNGPVSADAVEGFADYGLVVEKPERGLHARPVKVAARESFRVDAETSFARYSWILTGKEDHRVLLFAWVHPPDRWSEYSKTFEQMIDELSCLAWL